MAEEDLLELILAFLPENFGGMAGAVVAVAAILSYALPAPAEDAHPALKIGHKLLCILGMGAARLRTAGRIGSLLRKGAKKP